MFGVMMGKVVWSCTFNKKNKGAICCNHLEVFHWSSIKWHCEMFQIFSQCNILELFEFLKYFHSWWF
jgi:hypothetical protein